MVDALRAAGYRLTPDRAALLSYMAQRETLVSIGDLVEQAREFGVSRPTVFRLLEALTAQGMAVRFTEENGSRTFYTFCTRSHHHHIVCTGCGRVEQVETPHLELELRDVAEHKGYEVHRHNLELFGLCPGCRAGQPA
jgi:Fur family ferric uptake transcriptional regulator